MDIRANSEVGEYTQIGIKDNFQRCKARNCRTRCIVAKIKSYLLGYGFYCFKCKKSYSVVDKFFFKQMRLKIKNVLSIMWLWCCEASSGCAAMMTGIKKV